MIKKLLYFSFLFLLNYQAYTQCSGITIFTEDFETNGNTVNGGDGRYNSPNDFYDDAGDDDYWGRVNGTTQEYYLTDMSSNLIANSVSAYTGYNGSFFYAAEDTDDIGGTLGSPDGIDEKSVSFTGININGATSLCFSGLCARGETNSCGASRYDSTDYIAVYYNVDSTGEQLGMLFSADLECDSPGNLTNEPLHFDSNLDGDGGEGPILTNTLTEFTFNIPTNGVTLDIRIEVHMDAASEEIAFDYLRLVSDTPLNTEKFDLASLKLYPNPSNSGSFTLKNNGTALDNINVVDINGRTVYSSALNNVTTDQVFDLNLVSGLYFVNITSEEASTVKKLIVK